MAHLIQVTPRQSDLLAASPQSSDATRDHERASEAAHPQENQIPTYSRRRSGRERSSTVPPLQTMRPFSKMKWRSARLNNGPMFLSMTMMDRPLPFPPFTQRHISTPTRGARPSVGSSRISSRGLVI